MWPELVALFDADNEAGFLARAMALGGNRTQAENLWSRLRAGTISRTGTNIPSGNNSSFGSQAISTVTSALQTQEMKPYFKGREQEQFNIGDVRNILVGAHNQMNSFGTIFNNVIETAKGSMETFWSNQTALLNEINKKTGLTGKLSADFRQEMTDAWPALNKIGIGMEDLGSAAIQLVTQSGKFAMINKTTWEEAGKAAVAYVGSLSELVGMFPEFQKIGLGAKNAIEAVEKAGQGAIELGIDSHKMTKELATNVGLLNSYGFKNGVKGIADMNTKALEFRMNLADITRIADKVWSPEGAINLSANLQVLGGAIGDFNDPLKLMYMATNNVEGLQDALIKASSSLATYNREQGRFEVTGVNLRRAKEMADQFGMSMKDLTTGAVAYQERTSAMADLSGLKISQEDKEFLTNIAQMEDGKMTIELAQSPKLQHFFNDATKVTIDQLGQAGANQILEYRKEFQKLTPDEIIRNQATSVANIERDLDFMVAVQKVSLGKAGQQMADIIGVKGMSEKFDEFTKKFGSVGIVEKIKSMVTQEKNSQVAKNDSISSNQTTPKSKEETKTVNNQNQSNEVTIKHEMKFDMTGPVLMDAVTHEIIRNPILISNMIKNNEKEYGGVVR